MKREGRLHGMVRSCTIITGPWQSQTKITNLNELSAPPTAGSFTKVSIKPTNHSKFTGKCRRPMCRGCHNNPACKSRDKVKGSQKIRSSADLGFSGFSATRILDEFMDRDYDDEYIDYVSETYRIDEIEDDGFEVNNNVDSDDAMSFCEVGLISQSIEGDESWCLIDEI